MANIYNFFKTPKELQNDAQENLAGYNSTAIGGVILYYVIIAILCFPIFLNIFWLKISAIILLVIVFPPLTLGLCKFTMGLVGDTPSKIKEIFDGFKYFFKSTIIFWVCFFQILFFTILLIIPGIKKTMSLSMCYYILLNNPKEKVFKIIKESATIMENHEWRLLKLIFSFSFKFVLGILSLGIYLLFLTPQFNTSIALFYKNIK